MLIFHPWILRRAWPQSGVTMSRTIGRLLMVSLLSMAIRTPGTRIAHHRALTRDPIGQPPATPLDVAALLTAAHGAPPVICALAAHAIRNTGWGYWTAAPSTPLARGGAEYERERDAKELPAADADRLLAGLASDDACVRELSVRLPSGESSDRAA